MDLHKIDWENIPWEPVREGITRKSFSGNGATLALHKLMPKHEPKPHKHTIQPLHMHTTLTCTIIIVIMVG